MNNISLVNRVNNAKELIGAEQIVKDMMDFMSSSEVEQFLEHLEEEHEIDTTKDY